MKSTFGQDIDAWIVRNGQRPQLWSRTRFFLFSPGIHFLAFYRFVGLSRKIPVIGRLISQITWLIKCSLFRCEIALDAVVGSRLYVPHPYGIVIGVSRIGSNVTILQNVTIGVLKRGDKSIPIIEDDVFIGAGAVILGAVTIGAGAVIGANAVVLSDVPPGMIAAGVPAKIRKAR